MNRKGWFSMLADFIQRNIDSFGSFAGGTPLSRGHMVLLIILLDRDRVRGGPVYPLYP